jgi:hypothetical protein
MKAATKYPGVVIYEGALGETPKAGAFYAAKAGDVLARIAKAAGTTYAKVSIHPWNQANLTYVTKETGGAKCSPIAKTAAEKRAGFISLCKVGGVYQTMWIPGPYGEGPEEISAATQTKTPTGGGLIINTAALQTAVKAAQAAMSATTSSSSTSEATKQLLNDGVRSGSTTIGTKTSPLVPSLSPSGQPVTAGMSPGMIAGIAGVAIATALLFFVPTKKGKRR